MKKCVSLTKPVRLDLPSETIFAWEQEGFSQTAYAAFSLQGRCDVEALKASLLEAQATRPNFHSYLAPMRYGIFQALGWYVSDEKNELEVRDFTNLPKPPADRESWIHEQMAPVVNHVHDLSNEFPFKCILFRLPENLYYLVVLFHHVAVDGGGLYDYLRDAFRLYHLKVKGAEPKWADVAGIHAQAGDIKPVEMRSFWSQAAQFLRRNRKYPITRAAQIEAKPAAVPGRYMVRHVIEDQAFQKAVRERARRDGGSISDLFLTASMLALAEWNQARNARADIMYHGLAVNQRLRRRKSEIQGWGNPLSAIAIATDAADRRDPQMLLEFVIRERKELMDQGYDMFMNAFVHKVLQAGHIFPLSIRYRVLRKILDLEVSFFLTNVGVVWPRIENGKPTGQTAIREIGDFELLDIHSSVGGTKANPIGMVLRSFLEKLYVVFPINGKRISPDEARAFSTLILQKVEGYL